MQLILQPENFGVDLVWINKHEYLFRKLYFNSHKTRGSNQHPACRFVRKPFSAEELQYIIQIWPNLINEMIIGTDNAYGFSPLSDKQPLKKGWVYIAVKNEGSKKLLEYTVIDPNDQLQSGTIMMQQISDFSLDSLSNPAPRKPNVLYVEITENGLGYGIIGHDDKWNEGKIRWSQIPSVPKDPKSLELLRKFLPELLKAVAKKGHATPILLEKELPNSIDIRSLKPYFPTILDETSKKGHTLHEMLDQFNSGALSTLAHEAIFFNNPDALKILLPLITNLEVKVQRPNLGNTEFTILELAEFMVSAKRQDTQCVQLILGETLCRNYANEWSLLDTLKVMLQIAGKPMESEDYKLDTFIGRALEENSTEWLILKLHQCHGPLSPSTLDIYVEALTDHKERAPKTTTGCFSGMYGFFYQKQRSYQEHLDSARAILATRMPSCLTLES